MVARGRGGGKTPERVVKVLSDEVAKHGQNATARTIGLSLYSLHRYLKGIGEPTQATLEAIAAYFGVTVAWLRGEEEEDRQKRVLEKIGEMTGEEMLMLVTKSLFGGEKEALEELKKAGFTEEEATIYTKSIGDRFGKELLPNLLEGLHLTIFKPLIDQALNISLDVTPKNEKKFATMLKNIGSNLELDVLTPTLKELALMPASELPGIAAIIKRFRENEAFNLEARKLLNNSVAHSK